MATPAEIIAARINGIDLSQQNDAPKPVLLTVSETKAPKVRSINDENAFPVLGGSAKPANGHSSSSSWGPNLNGSSPVPSASAFRSTGQSAKLKTSTVQEAFSLGAEDQLNVARPEFVKILTSIKATTGAGIECTSSQHTKKRTFLISGKPEQVKQAKRLVIKKLSKPIVTSFAIPAKVRSKVIGAQGRNLKPIIQQTEVKIEIGNSDRSVSPDADDDDDLFSQTVNVALEGDAESCKLAKSLIMAIVREETKNAQTKIVVSANVKPFVTSIANSIAAKYSGIDITVPPFNSASNSVIILGEREALLSAREDLNQALTALEGNLVTESVNIPKVKHQFLPVEQILEEDNVYIKIPADGEGEVQFIGDRLKLASAKEKARLTTSQYKVESLEMSKAHKGNLAHVRAVASMLNKYGVFDRIASENGVKINAPSDSALCVEGNTLIPVDIVVKADEAEAIKNSRRAVVSAVNAISPSSTKVVEDIDSFFIKAATEVLDAFSGVKYVTLNNRITLFDASEAETGDDFDDFVELSSDVLIEADRALNPFRSLQEGLVSEVLLIPSANQKHLSGPNGSTLKALLNSVEHNTISIKLHSNGTGSSADEVYIKGFKDEVAKMKKEFEEILAEVSEFSATGGYTTTVNVPAFVLARIIGKGGANLKAIQDEFGVDLDVADESKDLDKTDKLITSEITIKGLKRNAQAAKAKLAASAKKLADDTLVRLRIESQYHRRIMGPAFSYVNRLREKYSVIIRFPSENGSNYSDAPQSANEVVIRGLSRNVAKAQEELMQLYQFEKENGFKATLQIPKAAIGRVIGRNGENIKDISDATGAELLFRDRKEDAEFAEVDITGSKAGLQDATQRVKSIIEEIENTINTTLKVNRKYIRDIVGQSGSTLRAMITNAGGDLLPRQQYARLVTVPSNGSDSDEIVFEGDKTIVEKLMKEIEALVAEKEAAVTETYELAKEKQRLLVGSFGSVRRQLEEEFGVQLVIPKADDNSTTIKLIGLPEKIEKLKVKIEELTKDNWNMSIDIPLSYHALVSDKGSLFALLRQNHNVEVSHGNLNRKANKAMDAIPPAPPAEALGGDEATKFTTATFEITSDNDDVIPWRLIGSDEDTKAAAKVIESRLEQAKNATTAAWLYSLTPSDHFPKIVGARGSKIKKIRDSTGCFIVVPRDSHKYRDYVYFVGSEESLNKARDQIQKLL
ncbi:hypothetical protein PUMCH_000110 [Australozyma saopauloensis]|uniref:K Homology domain-containing protein n=1 Tax=Australozyma saopauloensis TaxID=291208 RepID=A0AAX4H3K9_9ASCO|nr:hypothetical protein PUMCH_000110 [[Candida] saopauloensis]